MQVTLIKTVLLYSYRIVFSTAGVHPGYPRVHIRYETLPIVHHLCRRPVNSWWGVSGHIYGIWGKFIHLHTIRYNTVNELTSGPVFTKLFRFRMKIMLMCCVMSQLLLIYLDNDHVTMSPIKDHNRGNVEVVFLCFMFSVRFFTFSLEMFACFRKR